MFFYGIFLQGNIYTILDWIDSNNERSPAVFISYCTDLEMQNRCHYSTSYLFMDEHIEWD